MKELKILNVDVSIPFQQAFMMYYVTVILVQLRLSRSEVVERRRILLSMPSIARWLYVSGAFLVSVTNSVAFSVAPHITHIDAKRCGLMMSTSKFSEVLSLPSDDKPTSRRDALATFGLGVSLFTVATAADAKDEGAAAGTKSDPKFQACLSQCLYLCTKPKGPETRSRQECLPECRKSCATTKAQEMLGVPRS